MIHHTSVQSQRSNLDIESHHGHASLAGGGQQRSADLRRHWRWSPDCALSVASSHQLMEPVFTLRVSSLTQKQRHRDRDTAQQDTEYCRIEYCSAAAHSWSGWRASGRNLAVRVPSHCTAPAGDMSPMGPPVICCHLCHHQTCSTSHCRH